MQSEAARRENPGTCGKRGFVPAAAYQSCLLDFGRALKAAQPRARTLRIRNTGEIATLAWLACVLFWGGGSAPMTASNALLSRQSQHLLQLGMILVLFASFEGFVIPSVASPRIGLSVHTLSAFQGVFMLAVGLLWPRLNFGVVASLAAFWLFIYGAASILAAYMIAAVLGVGIETISLMGELPHGLSHGTRSQEVLVKAVAFSSAPTGLISFVLILWGLCRARAEA